MNMKRDWATIAAILLGIFFAINLVRGILDPQNWGLVLIAGFLFVVAMVALEIASP